MATPEPISRTGGAQERVALVSTPITIGGRRLEILHPPSVDDLIDEETFDRDDRLPYWGAIWPSARVLSRRVAAVEGRGRRLLELGCGVGLVALAAAGAGFDVLAIDYYSEACDITAANAARNGALGIRTRTVDWRHWPADLGRFDCVVASDVLYERGNAALVAGVFEQTLTDRGVGWLTDPGRSIAKTFAAECRARGLTCDCIDLEQVVNGAMNCVVELFEIRRRP